MKAQNNMAGYSGYTGGQEKFPKHIKNHCLVSFNCSYFWQKIHNQTTQLYKHKDNCRNVQFFTSQFFLTHHYSIQQVPVNSASKVAV
jgi:hypothetical protein